jgi:hypothetical protein
MKDEAMKQALSCIKSSSEYKRGNATFVETAEDIEQALAAPVQSLPFGVGGGLVAIKTLLSRDPCVHANIAIEAIDAILKEHPATQPAPVQERCEYCDGTGDVHDRTGEWRGVCNCEAGKRLAAPAQPAPEQYAALEQALTRLQKRYGELESRLAAQPATEESSVVQPAPVAWMHEWEDGERVPMLRKRDVDSSDIDSPKSVRPLVFGDTTPPAQEFVCSTGLCHYKPAAQRQWVGLTDEKYGAMYNTHLRNGGPIQHFTRAIEAELKELNT